MSKETMTIKAGDSKPKLPACPECGAEPLRLHAPGCPRDLFGEGVDGVDGSDVDRVTSELIARGGPDAILGRFLRDKLVEHWAATDPESCEWFTPPPPTEEECDENG